jgi:hypothetical protein
MSKQKQKNPALNRTTCIYCLESDKIKLFTIMHTLTSQGIP